jgi:transcription initiation factor TFIIIB Brf1 subunit/transcription initiation factor TFIIB
MDCPICKGLQHTFEAKRDAYVAARYATYYRVSTELAAIKNVDMERARSPFDEHQLMCGTANVKVKPPNPRNFHHL